MQYSDAGFALTETFEGRRLTAYRDSGGVLTNGYGHTGPDVTDGQQISAAQADHWLHEDVVTAVDDVNAALVRVPALKQCQFDALVDFCFNVGGGNFRASHLLAFVRAGHFDAAAAEFGKWVRAAGVIIPGRVRRRAAEAAMFRGEAA
jgi:lysozyme